jgi:linoleoyl-CoA desaturase
MRHVTFGNRNDEFWETLKKRADAYFTSGNLTTYANRALWYKMVFMIIMTIAPYLLILSGWFSPWQMWLLCVVLGIFMAGIGLCVSHQAAHNTISPSKKVNRALSLTFNLVGLSDYIWKIKHNVFHHAYTNVYELDEGLREGEIMRLSADAPYLKVHRWQHIYGFLLYAVFTIFWTFTLDIEKLFRYNGNGSRNPSARHPAKELVLFWLTKIYIVIISFVLPFYFLHITIVQFLAGFLTVHAIASMMVTLVFQVEHLTEETEHVSPDGQGTVNCSWALTQLKGTSNFKTRTKLFEWYVGGTNYQVEHHLFPQVSSVHYPALSRIVQQTAIEFGLKYHCQPSFLAATVSHYHFLKQMGRPPLQTLKATV